MQVNDKVKKILAALALIDDTQEQITIVKGLYSKQIEALQDEASSKVSSFKNTMNDQMIMLRQLIEEPGEITETVSFSSRSATTKNHINDLKNKALLYIGRQMAYPSREEGEKDNGQTLSSTNS